MDLPTIHCCNMLTSENEKLSHKYSKLTKRYKVLEKRFYELKDQMQQEQAFREKSELLERLHNNEAGSHSKENKDRGRRPSTAALSVTRPTGFSVLAQQKLQANDEKTNKILSMHNELIKKYEKEMKINTSRIEKITKLALEKSNLQKELNEKKELIDDLQKQLETKDRLQKCQRVKNRLTPKMSDLKNKLSSLEVECGALRKENAKLRGELSCLDKGFFEEVEDLKYALQRSARLNSEYEKALKKICTQFGVDYKPLIKDRDKKLKRRSQSREFRS